MTTEGGHGDRFEPIGERVVRLMAHPPQGYCLMRRDRDKHLMLVPFKAGRPVRQRDRHRIGAGVRAVPVRHVRRPARAREGAGQAGAARSGLEARGMSETSMSCPKCGGVAEHATAGTRARCRETSRRAGCRATPARQCERYPEDAAARRLRDVRGHRRWCVRYVPSTSTIGPDEKVLLRVRPAVAVPRTATSSWSPSGTTRSAAPTRDWSRGDDRFFSGIHVRTGENLVIEMCAQNPRACCRRLRARLTMRGRLGGPASRGRSGSSRGPSCTDPT